MATNRGLTLLVAAAVVACCLVAGCTAGNTAGKGAKNGGRMSGADRDDLSRLSPEEQAAMKVYAETHGLGLAAGTDAEQWVDVPASEDLPSEAGSPSEPSGPETPSGLSALVKKGVLYASGAATQCGNHKARKWIATAQFEELMGGDGAADGNGAADAGDGAADAGSGAADGNGASDAEDPAPGAAAASDSETVEEEDGSTADPSVAGAESAEDTAPADFFAAYKPYDELIQWFDRFATDNSDIVWKETIGSSVEGRRIDIVTIAGANAAQKQQEKKQPMIFLNFASHAREWITHMGAVYTAKTLVEKYRSDSAAAHSIDQVGVAILYMQNPDGYVFSWSEGSFTDSDGESPNRFWRKNRAKNADGTMGVDPLFNYDWDMWAKLDGDYAKPNGLMYKGPEPFSEPETRAVRDFVRGRPGLIRAFADFHSFSQYIMWSPDMDKIGVSEGLGKRMAETIKALHGTKYSPFGATNGLDLWVAQNAGHDSKAGVTVPAFTIEMRPDDACGFELPTQFIVPACQEAGVVVDVLHQYAIATL